MIRFEALRRLARAARNGARGLLFAVRHSRNPWQVVRGLLRQEGEAEIVLRDGTTISAPEARTLVPLLLEIFVDRAYDREPVALRAGDVVVDIGAHAGTFALYAVARGARRVIAYEPSPVNVAHARRNLERNGARAVELVEAAVAAEEGTALLGLARYSVGNVLLGTVDEPTERSVEVRTTTLAGIFADHGIERVDYLKIDCEGSEGALFAAAPADVLERIDRIALEYHDNWSSLDHEALARLLRSAGFSVTTEPHGRSPFGMLRAWRP